MDMVEYMLNDIALLPPLEIRAAIVNMEQFIKADEEISLPSESCPLKHVFAPGCYLREITMPKGMLVIGKIHKHAHGNVLSKGRCKVITEQGIKELIAPCTFVSEPSTKRLVYVIEDTIWTTMHVTDKTDLAEIEQEIIAKDYSEVEISGEFRREE